MNNYLEKAKEYDSKKEYKLAIECYLKAYDAKDKTLNVSTDKTLNVLL